MGFYVVLAVYLISRKHKIRTNTLLSFCSTSKAGLKAPPNLYVMMATLLARSNRYAEIALFVSNKVSLLFSVFNDDYIVYYRAMFHPYGIWIPIRYGICEYIF
jgi:ABC-type nickel/cobalt efflux system permease component RcnA